MKKILAGLCFLIIVVTANTAVLEENAQPDRLTILSQISGSLLEDMIADDYDMERFISKPNAKASVGDLECILLETAADPRSLTTVIQVSHRDPEAELREWGGLEEELQDALAQIEDAEDHCIMYVNIAPDAPYLEDGSLTQVQGNCMVRWSGSSHRSRDELFTSELNRTYTVHEVFLVDVIQMHSGKWERFHDEITFDIQVWSATDCFVLPTPAVFPEYDLQIDRACVYLTPFEVYYYQWESTLSGKKRASYYTIISGNPPIRVSEKLPDSITVSIAEDASDTVVYREEWIKKDTGVYAKPE